MFLRLLLLFTVVPVIELYILIKIGTHFGALTTIALVIGTGIIGAYLARQQGFFVWLRLQREMQEGRFPGDALLDGFLILIAGVLLLTPGLLTDICGFLLLIPVTRTLIKRWLKKKIAQMIQSGNTTFTGFIR